MSDTQKPAFLSIMSKIGRDPSTTPISCAICSDGGHGGAMGPAQFMPQTWNAITAGVTRILGVKNPSPFENLHAFTASGLLLKENQDRCKTAFTSKYQIWSCSAAKYYGGLFSKGSKLEWLMSEYGNSVANRAIEFEEKIYFLDS